MPDDASGQLGISPGDVLAGKYRVDGFLGVGGMGVVVAAHHLKLDQRVAIKLLRVDALDDTEAAARFEREARAAVKIKSEHIAKVTDVGTLDNGVPYMVMEYLEGEDLAARIRQRGGMPIPEAVEIVLQACEVLAEAHQLGIVHRDLKPANLFCVDDGDGEIKIKVLDFGISKVINLRPSLAGMSITRTSAVMGSPVYMSPEQMQTPRDVDARTDIWSAGIILYELLVGRVPFDGETLPEVCVKVATQTLPSIRRYRLDVPAGLEAVVRRCLEKERDARFRSVAEFAHALAPFAPSRARPSLDRIVRSAKGSEAIAPRRHDSDHPVLPRNIATSWWRTSPWSVPRWAGWRGPTGLIIAAALGATGIALLGVGLLPRETSPTSATSAVLVEPAPRRKQAEPPMIETAATARAFLVPSDLPLAEQAPVAPAPSTRAAPKTDAGKTAPSGGTCTLNFNSIPVAAVALDGERLGATPKIGFTAPVGTHLVTFEHAEYGTMTKSVTCENGETKAVSVRLSRAITTPLGEPDIETNPYR